MDLFSGGLRCSKPVETEDVSAEKAAAKYMPQLSLQLLQYGNHAIPAPHLHSDQRRATPP
jgi:hypothetical protein